MNYMKSKALKELTEQIHQRKLERSTMPPAYVPKTKFTDTTANGLTQCIISYLELLGGWASRISSAGRYIQGVEVVDVIGRRQRTRGRWIPGTTRTGTPDIIGNLNGLFLGIEVKIGRDRLSDKQMLVQNKIQESGGLYIVARNFAQFKDRLNGQFKMI